MEIWLSLDIFNSELSLNNFHIYRVDRNSSTSNCICSGGMLIIIKSKFVSSFICTNIFNVEQIFVLAKIASIQFHFGAVYVPRHSHVEIYDIYIYI